MGRKLLIIRRLAEWNRKTEGDVSTWVVNEIPKSTQVVPISGIENVMNTELCPNQLVGNRHLGMVMKVQQAISGGRINIINPVRKAGLSADELGLKTYALIQETTSGRDVKIQPCNQPVRRHQKQWLIVRRISSSYEGCGYINT